MSDRDVDDSLPPPIGAELPALIATIKRTCAKSLAWQKTPEGQRERARFERKQLEKQRAERDEFCTLRGVPDDVEVRRWALEPHPSGPLFDAVREAIAWQREQQERLGGLVPVVRFLLGSPGTGKSSALSWAVSTWPKRARYVTADELCRAADGAWNEAASVSLLALDELGIEAHPDRVTELLLRRWAKGLLTLCGSNLELNELAARYTTTAGSRLLDRLRSQHERGLRPSVVATWSSLRGGDR